MENVSVESLKQQIRVALDENHVSTELTGLQDTDTLTLNEIIESKIEDAAEAVVRSASIDMIGDIAKQLDYPYVVSSQPPMCLRMSLPSDFLRLIRFKVAGWSYAVHEVAEPTRETLMKLHSPYGVLGTAERPVVTICPANVTFQTTPLIPAYLYGEKMYRPLDENGKLKEDATTSDYTEANEVKGRGIDTYGIYRWQNLPDSYLYYVWYGDTDHPQDTDRWESITPSEGVLYENIDSGMYGKWEEGEMVEVEYPTNGLALEAYCVPTGQSGPDNCLYAATPKIASGRIMLGSRLIRPTVYYAASLVADTIGNEKAAEKLLAVCKEKLNIE